MTRRAWKERKGAMKAEQVNAFLVPALNVVSKMAKVSVELGKPFKVDKDSAADEAQIGTIIGISGGIMGSVTLCAMGETARLLCGRVAGEEPDALTDEDIHSIFAEIANTIAGNAAGGLYDLGIKADITPPTVVRGKGMQVRFRDDMDIMNIPIIMEFGRLNLIVAFSR